jgi:hypothetical protein
VPGGIFWEGFVGIGVGALCCWMVKAGVGVGFCTTFILLAERGCIVTICPLFLPDAPQALSISIRSKLSKYQDFLFAMNKSFQSEFTNITSVEE